MNWNDDQTGAAWQQVAYLNTFDQAIWERELAADPEPASFSRQPPYTPLYHAGDLLQGNLASFTRTAACMMQSRLNQIAGYFVQPDWDPTTSPANALLANSANAHWTTTGLQTAAGYAEGDWRRIRHRSVASPTSTQDNDGNSAMAGQVAWVIPATPNQAFRGRFDGATWQKASIDTAVDIIASNSPPPNHCSPGLVSAGDFLGAHIWNQLRDFCNLLQRTTVTPAVANTQYYYGDNFAGGSPTYAAAQAAAQAAFAPTATPYRPCLGAAAGGTCDPDGSGTYYAYACTGSQSYQVSAAAHLLRSFAFYMPISDCLESGTLTGPFDRQNSSYGNNLVTHWCTIGPSSNATETSPQFQDVSQFPPDFPAPPLPATGFNPIGWSMLTINGAPLRGQIVMITWSFTQGPPP